MTGKLRLGLIGLGEIAFSDIPKLVEIKQSYMPQPENRTLYDERFDTFKKIYKQMKPIYKKLNG